MNNYLNDPEYQNGNDGNTPEQNASGATNQASQQPGQPNQTANNHNPYNQYNNYYQVPTNQEQYHWNLPQYENITQPKKKKSGKKVGIAIAAVLCCALFVSALGLSVVGAMALFGQISPAGPTIENGVSDQQIPNSNASAPSITLNNQPENDADGISATGELNGQQIYEKVSPSVVGILNYTADNYSTTPNSQGSGVIMSSDGYIITNAHVVSEADALEVVLYNDERYQARLVGYDARTDLAVVKIEAQNLVAAEFGNSDELSPGEVVYAIGNPGGLEFANSITDGMISGINRVVQSSTTGYSMKYIQTNAAINPGNSGGALIDRFGRVVGINTAKLSTDSGSSITFEGMGFAIPITQAKDVIDDLIKYGYVTGRPKIGISLYPISNSAAVLYSIPTGLEVVTVDPASDAYAKGLRPADIIVKVNNIKVDTTSDIYEELEKCKPGDSMMLTVFRRPEKGPDMTYEITIILSEDNGQNTTTESTPTYPQNPSGQQ